VTSTSKPSHGVMAARASRGTSSGRNAAGSLSASPAADESSHKSASDSNGARASVRVYRQGLGDCILVTVKRPNGDDFKLLIDCGVVLGTENAVDAMTRVVENLVHDTDQKVDVIAITHEHWDIYPVSSRPRTRSRSSRRPRSGSHGPRIQVMTSRTR